MVRKIAVLKTNTWEHLSIIQAVTCLRYKADHTLTKTTDSPPMSRTVFAITLAHLCLSLYSSRLIISIRVFCWEVAKSTLLSCRSVANVKKIYIQLLYTSRRPSKLSRNTRESPVSLFLRCIKDKFGNQLWQSTESNIILISAYCPSSDNVSFNCHRHRHCSRWEVTP